MLGVLRFILIVFLVLTVLGYLSRFLLKLFLLRLAKKIDKQQEANKGQRVGDAYIKANQTKEKVVDKNVGDYVDFEEVEPKQD
jgi:hypothetical protein